MYKVFENVPQCLIENKSLLDHMHDFIQNRVRLGKILDTLNGESGMPVYSPRDGILNAQYTMNNIKTVGGAVKLDIYQFMEDKLKETETYPKWMLINEDKVGCHDVIKSSTFPFNVLYSLATNQ